MAKSMMPAKTVRAKTFQSRTYLFLYEQQWKRDSDRSDLELDTLVNKWVDKESPEITFISPPSVNVYQMDEQNQMVIASISLLYVPAVEGAQHGSAEDGEDSVGGMAGGPKPAGQDSAGVYEPPREEAGKS